MSYRHTPVMLREVLELMKPENGKNYLDGTLGGGGHAEKILELSSPDGRLLGMDRDDEAVTASRQRLQRFGDRCVLRQANFAESEEILKQIGWGKVAGIVLDLGLSSQQVDSLERGFSFHSPHRLDMRMDRREPLDAYQVVNGRSATDLERIFREYGEEPRARRVALAIESARRSQKIETARELAEIVSRALGRGQGRTHPATRIFQALRIAVNQELETLASFLENAYELLMSKGRLVVISFHSLEDRLVKTAFRKWSKDCLCPPRTPVCRCGWSAKVRLLTGRPLVASPEEVRMNPRSRSAKLRAVERL
ncbi:MAG: 16S rRNA (cytosine(1402)-N(4))-methyltransferase RsmH [Candidatus Binatia bacterium]